jgi:hypothetical protein
VLLHAIVSSVHAHIILTKPYENGSNQVEATIFSVVACLDILVAAIGMCILHRSRMVPDGCSACCHLRCQHFPLGLLVVNVFFLVWNIATSLSEAVSSVLVKSTVSYVSHLQPLDWCYLMLAHVDRLVVLAFSLQWVVGLYNQSRISSYGTRFDISSYWWCAGHSMDKDDKDVCDSAQKRFAVLRIKESKKFEMAYIVVEFAGIVIFSMLAVRSKSTRFTKQLAVPFLCLLLRLCRCLTPMRSSGHLDKLCALLDVFNFNYYAFLAALWHNGALCPFVLHIILSYMVFFVFPFCRAVVVVSLCYVTYSVTFVYVHAEHSNINAGMGDMVSELSLLAVGLCITVTQKRVSEMSKWQVFRTVEEKTEEALQEKVSQCQEEFARDYPFEDPVAAKAICGAKVETPDKCYDYYSKLHIAPSGTSLHSAPAVLRADPQQCDAQTADSEELRCCSANCLLPASLAWVENEAQPKLLQDLKPGDKVLCYDRLGATMKHTALLEVKVVDGPVEWVTVMLEDGTALEMTCDHLVQPSPTSPDQGAAMPTGPHARPMPVTFAGELQPGIHSLTVLKVVPIPVKSVQRRQSSKNMRMALTVQQSERHAIFIGSPGDRGARISPIAVESANANEGGIRIASQAKNTFLNVVSTRNSDNQIQRCRSAPELGGAVSFSLMDGASVTHIADPSASISELSSLSSTISGQLGWDCEVQVSGALAPRASEDGILVVPVGQNAPAVLSDLVVMRTSGYRSMGSVDHASGSCKPCIHNSRWTQGAHSQGASPCFKGPLCERCHEDHQIVSRSQKRRPKKLGKLTL